MTGLLAAWSKGDAKADDCLIHAVYAELRAPARGYIRRERPDHSLAPTALVHEASLRLGQDRVRKRRRRHAASLDGQNSRERSWNLFGDALRSLNVEALERREWQKASGSHR